MKFVKTSKNGVGALAIKKSTSIISGKKTTRDMFGICVTLNDCPFEISFSKKYQFLKKNSQLNVFFKIKIIKTLMPRHMVIFFRNFPEPVTLTLSTTMYSVYQ